MGCLVSLHTKGNGLHCDARKAFLPTQTSAVAGRCTSALPVANINFLLEIRNEHVVCRLQVSEKVFVDSFTFGNCYLWCAAVRKLNWIRQRPFQY